MTADKFRKNPNILGGNEEVTVETDSGIPLFRKKIQTRLLVLILGVVTLVLTGFAGVTYYQTFLLVRELIEEKSRDEVEVALNKIARWIEERRKVIDVLAHVESRNFHLHSNTEQYFKDIASQFKARALYFTEEATGKYISGDNWIPPKNWDPRNRPWYLMAKESQDSIITAPYQDTAPPHDKIITIASAIREDDILRGVIAMDVPIDAFKLIVSEVQLGRYSKAYLLTEQGEVIERSYSEDKNSVKKITLPEVENFLSSEDEIKTYVGEDYQVIASIPDTGLIIALHIPLSEAHYQLTKLGYIFMTGIIASLVLLALFMSWASAHITRPVHKLADAANQVISGNYNLRLPLTSEDEIGLLTYRFNLMVEGLQEKEVIRSAFGRYVSPEAVSEILDGKIELGGEKRLVSILICDLRNFTSYTESTDPEFLVRQLNAYYTKMDEAVRMHHGSINRYLGDGLLALFGAPALLENSALCAVHAALAMVRALDEFNREMNTSFEIGIGIHTGVGVVGNIGSTTHTEYTIIGDVANLTSRIESLTKVYGEKILMSGTTSALLPQGMFIQKEIDRVKVQGRTESVQLYAAYEKTELEEELLESSKRILKKYQLGHFKAAAEEILSLDNSLRTPHLETLLLRCQEFINKTPPLWDGTFHMKSK
jgi:class 3 adenylate cyclase/flagellar biosynthesis protein FliQ